MPAAAHLLWYFLLDNSVVCSCWWKLPKFGSWQRMGPLFAVRPRLHDHRNQYSPKENKIFSRWTLIYAQGFALWVWTFLLWLHGRPYWHLTTAKPQLELKSLLRTCLWKLLWHAVSHDRGECLYRHLFFQQFPLSCCVQAKASSNPHEYLQRKNWGKSARAHTM